MSRTAFPPWLSAILLFLLLVLVIGGGWLYYRQKELLQDRAENELQTITQLKVDEIAAWRGERLADAAILTESPLFLDDIADWLADPQSETTEKILAQFHTWQQHYHYNAIQLVDADLNVRLSSSGEVGLLDDDDAQALTIALQDQRPLLTDLHLGSSGQRPQIDAVAPLFDPISAEPMGGIILSSDASQFLYPLIQMWPVPSNSAESLIVRRDGDTVLFLNPLRFQPDAALNLRIPLTQKDVPAVRAVLGVKGIVEGKDYRGVEVLSALETIPDSPWFIVAKVDRTEVFADWQVRLLPILGMILGSLITVGTVGGVIWQRNQTFQYRKLFEAEKAHQKSEMRYQTTLLSIGDGVIVTDAEGQIVLLNPVAELLTGWTQSEANGKPLEAVFHIVSEETRLPMENPVRQVLQKGSIAGLANHTLLITKDGREIPIADSGAPTRSSDGVIEGIVLVFRDQTEERAAQKTLQESEAFIRTVLDNLPVGVAVNSVDPTYLFYMNNNFVRYYRSTREAMADSDTFWNAVYEDAEFREVMRKRVVEDVSSGDPARMHWDDIPITRQGEETTYISAQNTPIVGKQLMLSTVWDTTERKRAEEALQRYVEQLAAINRLDRIISSGLDLALVYDNFVKELLALVPLDRTAILLFNETGDEYQIARQWAQHESLLGTGQWVPVKGTAIEWLLANPVPFRENEIGERGTWSETAALLNEGIRTRLLLPLIIQDQMVGVLTAARYGASLFSQEEQAILATIADQLTIAIQNARLYERVQRYAAELEQRVIERTAELSDLYNNAPCGYHSLDKNGVFDRVNDTELRWLGYTREELIGKVKAPEILTPDSVQTFGESFTVLKERGWLKDLELDMVRKDGSIQPVLLTATAIYDQNGQYQTSRSTIIDHTEIRQARTILQERTIQLEAANKELEAFSYSVSHDLRAPLRAVDGFSRIVLRDYAALLPDEGQHRLQVIRESAQQMGRLIDDLLAFSRLSRQPVQKHRVSLVQMVRSVFEELNTENRQVEIRIGELPDCFADPTLLKQVIINLLSNALKFTQQHEVAEIEVGALSRDEKTVYYVKDNGVGFDMQYADKLFGVFQRLHRAEDFEGTGVGLAIVQRIIHRHGGQVWAESQVDGGATFYFTLEAADE
ncbi:MAG TPA: PAS domain S-box protein [Aggregatilineaceae bacterium]|nr:PAS domain S-box protein [Aggregatilineaceae bacterium]